MGYTHNCSQCGSEIDDDTGEIVKGKGCGTCNDDILSDMLAEEAYFEHVQEEMRKKDERDKEILFHARFTC